MAEVVHKVTLSTGKIVLMREPKIKHQELAAKAVGRRHEDTPTAQQMAIQNELLKIAIAQVDGADFKAEADLDSWFSMAEYNQLLKVLGQLCGGTPQDPLVEVSTSGGK